MSVDSSGAQGNGNSPIASISANGRYVVFASNANNLVAGDTNGSLDVFVHDRQRATASRVSVDSAGVQGNAGSGVSSISADGRYVAFFSFASNLVPGDFNFVGDVFVHDRRSGMTARVSVSSSGAEGNGLSTDPSISADGRYVAFWSDASNLVAGDTNGAWDVFVHDRQSSLTSRVSVHSSGAQGNDMSLSPSISADGRYVVFESHASNLVSGDTNTDPDIFVHDRQSGLTSRVSVDSSGAQANSASGDSTISAEGRYATFWSYSNNLVPGDTNGASDIFVHDRQSGMTSRVSVDSSGTPGNSDSYDPSISADGHHVTFWTFSNNLVPGDTNGTWDVIVHDRQSGLTSRVSVDSSGGQGNDSSSRPSISADGRHVAFASDASDLVAGDTNGVQDAFVHGCASVGAEYCPASSNSSGGPARISAACSASSAQGSLTLDAVPVPNQFGYFFHGWNQTQVVFGNGFLCASGDIVRGAVIQAMGNLATYTYDNSDSKHTLAAYVASTRHFQYWFRDPMGGGALFNTSNALSIAILP